MTRVKEFALAAFVAIVVAGSGFVAGRLSKPAPPTKVVEHHDAKVQVVTVEKQVAVVQERIKVVRVVERHRATVVEKQTVTKPDGTVIATERAHELVDTKAQDLEARDSASASQTVTAQDLKAQERHDTTTEHRRNDWMFGAQLRLDRSVTATVQRRLFDVPLIGGSLYGGVAVSGFTEVPALALTYTR